MRSTAPLRVSYSDPAARKKELAQIHIARHALGMAEDEYRAIVLECTGKASSADADAAGRQRLLRHFKACGWKGGADKKFTQAEKIRHLWAKLGKTGALNNATDEGLMVFVGRTAGVGVTDLKFLPVAQASKVIEVLKAWIKRSSKVAA